MLDVPFKNISLVFRRHKCMALMDVAMRVHNRANVFSDKEHPF